MNNLLIRKKINNRNLHVIDYWTVTLTFFSWKYIDDGISKFCNHLQLISMQ